MGIWAQQEVNRMSGSEQEAGSDRSLAQDGREKRRCEPMGENHSLALGFRIWKIIWQYVIPSAVTGDERKQKSISFHVDPIKT